MNHVIASDQLKMKRTFIKPISFLFPFLILFLSFLILSMQKESMTSQGNSMWESMVVLTHFIIMFVIPMATTIMVSNLISLEHQNNSWKLLFALPISKFSFYFSKLYVILKLCFLSGIVIFLGFIFIGKILNFKGDIPYALLLGEAFLPFLGVFPIITFQLWLSIRFKNQAFPIAIGVFGTVCMFFLQMHKITSMFFWAYPALMTPVKQLITDGNLAEIVPNGDLAFYTLLSIVFGLIFMVIGMFDFSRQSTE